MLATPDDDFAIRQLVSDILMLLVLADPLAGPPTIEPCELVLPSRAGLLGLAAGPWPLLAESFVVAAPPAPIDTHNAES